MVEYLIRKIQETDSILEACEAESAPIGWACSWSDKEKQYYYVHDITDEVSWTYPDEDKEAVLQLASKPSSKKKSTRGRLGTLQQLGPSLDVVCVDDSLKALFARKIVEKCMPSTDGDVGHVTAISETDHVESVKRDNGMLDTPSEPVDDLDPQRTVDERKARKRSHHSEEQHKRKRKHSSRDRSHKRSSKHKKKKSKSSHSKRSRRERSRSHSRSREQLSDGEVVELSSSEAEAEEEPRLRTSPLSNGSVMSRPETLSPRVEDSRQQLSSSVDEMLESIERETLLASARPDAVPVNGTSLPPPQLPDSCTAMPPPEPPDRGVQPAHYCISLLPPQPPNVSDLYAPPPPPPPPSDLPDDMPSEPSVPVISRTAEPVFYASNNTPTEQTDSSSLGQAISSHSAAAAYEPAQLPSRSISDTSDSAISGVAGQKAPKEKHKNKKSSKKSSKLNSDLVNKWRKVQTEISSEMMKERKLKQQLLDL